MIRVGDEIEMSPRFNFEPETTVLLRIASKVGTRHETRTGTRNVLIPAKSRPKCVRISAMTLITNYTNFCPSQTIVAIRNSRRYQVPDCKTNRFDNTGRLVLEKTFFLRWRAR